MTSSKPCSLSPSLHVPESSNHPQVLILCYSKIPIMLHFSVPIALHWAPIPHPTSPTTHHPPPTFCSAPWLSLLLSCLSSSSFHKISTPLHLSWLIHQFSISHPFPFSHFSPITVPCIFNTCSLVTILSAYKQALITIAQKAPFPTARWLQETSLSFLND